jgi:hypothetical protein
MLRKLIEVALPLEAINKEAKYPTRGESHGQETFAGAPMLAQASMGWY